VLNSYQVLRGAGRDRTNLRFTKAFADLQGWGQNYTAGRGASRFTWAGGLITNQQQKGVFAPSINLHLGHVVKPAKRGDTRLYVGQLVRNTSSAELLLKPGQWFSLAIAENAEVSSKGWVALTTHCVSSACTLRTQVYSAKCTCQLGVPAQHAGYVVTTQTTPVPCEEVTPTPWQEVIP
jgi:hypothetical protein